MVGDTGWWHRTDTIYCQCNVVQAIQKQFSALSELLFLFALIATYFWSDKECHSRIPKIYIVHVIGGSAKDKIKKTS